MSQLAKIKKRLPYALTIPVMVVLLDQWSKMWINNNLGLREHITVIDKYFHIVHVHNQGAAFGFLADWQHGFYFLSGVSGFAIVLILLYLFLSSQLSQISTLALSLILGGAIGNLIDRLRMGYVIDFIDWHYEEVYHWPAFNVADSAITTAVCLLVLDLIFEIKHSSAQNNPPAVSP